MIAKVTLILMAIPALALATAEQRGLRLEVFTEVREYIGGTEKPNHYALSIQPLIKNVSDKPISLATSTYTGHPTCWGGGLDEPLAFYRVGARIIGNRIVRPSPIKFCAVTLEPGESASLPEHEVEMSSRDEAKRVKVRYAVDEETAAKYGWWFGELELVQEVKGEE